MKKIKEIYIFDVLKLIVKEKNPEKIIYNDVVYKYKPKHHDYYNDSIQEYLFYKLYKISANLDPLKEKVLIIVEADESEESAEKLNDIEEITEFPKDVTVTNYLIQKINDLIVNQNIIIKELGGH